MDAGRGTQRAEASPFALGPRARQTWTPCGRDGLPVGTQALEFSSAWGIGRHGRHCSCLWRTKQAVELCLVCARSPEPVKLIPRVTETAVS